MTAVNARPQRPANASCSNVQEDGMLIILLILAAAVAVFLYYRILQARKRSH